VRVDDRHRPTVHGSPRDPIEAVVLKWTIPVDDRTHQVQWPSDAQVVHVAPDTAAVDVVLAWTVSTRRTDGGKDLFRFRNLRVYGTGQPIPTPCAHLGTAVTGVGLVWHLVELL